jgi:hypothetical protein
MSAGSVVALVACGIVIVVGALLLGAWLARRKDEMTRLAALSWADMQQRKLDAIGVQEVKDADNSRPLSRGRQLGRDLADDGNADWDKINGKR